MHRPSSSARSGRWRSNRQALTPQAKGRVERLFQTLQDRLVKAMRLTQINAMDAANAFLDTYLTGHNARFAVAPREQEDAHRPFKDDDTALARLCAVHHERTLSKALVLSFKGQRYIVQTHAGAPRYGLRGKKVSVIEHHDERIELVCRQEVLSYRVFNPRQDRHPAVDDKTLNERVDQAVAKARNPWKPAPSHPWRRYPNAAQTQGTASMEQPSIPS